ncbi:Bug family tripartite tricarboxylate transporter substrate binding protein [Propylenella binzhouense]|nr:tripartite tricarboxylate transporter substrate-binding protein [Propylenella binzhouense]
MKLTRSILLACAIGLSAGAAQPAAAQEEPFYHGKTVTILVGFGPGGGYDLFARLLSKHLPEHIPGAPTIVVENMGAAGGLPAANRVYAVAPKDGTVIASVNASLIVYDLVGGSAAEYDAKKLQWLGSGTNSNNSILTWHTSGVKTIEDAQKTEIPVGASGPASTSYIYPALANAVIGTKFKIINGYKGSNSLDLALESGEISGRSGANLNSLFARNADWVKDKKINFLVQIGYERDPALPDVPVLGELVSDPEDKQIVDLITLSTAFGYNYWVAPEVPADRVETLQKAFDETFADPDFVADAEKAGFEVRAQSGKDLQKRMSDVSNLSDKVIARTREILSIQ